MTADPRRSELGFFLNPFWKKFVGRRNVVVSLSEPEHRLRDARAIIALRQFLPPPESGLTTYLTVTVGTTEPPAWPGEISASSDTGLILVGRPALFGGEAMNFLEGCTPRMVYSFVRDDCPDEKLQTLRDYRAIVAPLGINNRFQSEPFDETRRQQPRPYRLKDLGIIYSGWKELRPLVIYGGSSTVSTWGAAVWSMQNPGTDDLRWFADVQGVVEASVVNAPRAFQTVHAEIHANQLLTPVSVWMDGPDLPPANAWKERLAGWDGGNVALRILANGKNIFKPNGFGYMVPLTLLAWINQRQAHPSGIFQASCTSAEIIAWVNAFLGKENAMGSRKRVQPQVNHILNDAVRYFNIVGGLATVEGKYPSHSRFTLWLRDPPGFLPTFRL